MPRRPTLFLALPDERKCPSKAILLSTLAVDGEELDVEN